MSTVCASEAHVIQCSTQCSHNVSVKSNNENSRRFDFDFTREKTWRKLVEFLQKYFNIFPKSGNINSKPVGDWVSINWDVYIHTQEISKYIRDPFELLLILTLHIIFHLHERLVKFKLPTHGTRDDFLHNGTFHEAVGFMMAFAQIFGICPVCGVRAPTVKHLKFQKCSIRFWLSIFYTISMAWILGMEIYWIFKTRIEFGKLITFFFDLTNWLSILCFLELAVKWPKLMQKWREVEKFLPQLSNEIERQRMAYEIKIVALVIMFGSMGKWIQWMRVYLHTRETSVCVFNESIYFPFHAAEHLLSIVVGTYLANNCPAIRDPIEAFYVQHYPYIFIELPYSGPLGIFVKALNIAASVAWTYTDLFVIMVSIGLSTMFRQINDDLMEVKRRAVDNSFWSEYRLYYREIVNLVSIVDKALAKIILISISNNLFFICVQLLRSLE